MRHPYALGVLTVHGIGNHERGATLQRMVVPVAAHLRVASAADADFTTSTVLPADPARGPAHGVLRVSAAGVPVREVLCAEAHWSRTVVRRRLSFLLWAVRNLAVLLILASLPDRRDEAAFATETKGFLRELLDQLQHPLFSDPASAALFRGGARLFLITLVVASLTSHPTWLSLAALGLLAVTVVRSRNVVGDVQLAAARPADRDRLAAEINRSLDWLLYQCREVVVVAHSQGGYLCHLALQQRNLPSYTPSPPSGVPTAPVPGAVRSFVGVGSGLKPIWTLEQADTPRLCAASWALVLATGLSGIVVLPALRGAVDLISNMLAYAGMIGAALVIPPARLSGEGLLEAQRTLMQEQLTYLWTPPWAEVGAPVFFAVMGSSLGLTLVAARLVRDSVKESPWPALPKPPLVHRWTEVTSPHDTVGRLLFPPLGQGARELVEPAFGNPMIDHVTYFRPASPALWDVAGEIAGAVDRRLADAAAHAEDGARQYLASRNARRRRLQIGLVAAATFFFLTWALPEGRGLTNFWTIGRSAWAVLLVFAGFHLWSVLRANADRRYALSCLASRQEGSSVRTALRDVGEFPRRWRQGLAAALFLLWVVTTAAATLVSQAAATASMHENAQLAAALAIGFLAWTLLAAAGYPLSPALIGVHVVVVAAVLVKAMMVLDFLRAGIPDVLVPGLLLGPMLVLFGAVLWLALALAPRVSMVTGDRSTRAGQWRQGLSALLRWRRP